MSTLVVLPHGQPHVEVVTPARNVEHIITGTLLPEISRELLGRMTTGDAAKTLRVTVEPDGRFGYAFT